MKKKKWRMSDDPFYNLEKVASMTECTGLNAAPPQTEQEDESLSSLYATHDAHDEE